MAQPAHRRTGFSRRAQYSLFIAYVMAVAGALVGVVLLALSTFDPPAFAALRGAAASVTTPVSSALAGIGRGIAAVPTAIGDYIAVHNENARLRADIARHRDLVLRARAVVYDNRRLKALLRVREVATDTIVVARLVSGTGSSTRRYALLNAGSAQGVQRGQSVRGPEGLVGQVMEAGPISARVLLLTDPESIVPVRRTRDGMPALAVGRGDGLLDVKSVTAGSAHFTPDDLFVTSGTGGIYPPGIPVARALERKTADTALAKSFAQPDTLDVALVQPAFTPPPPPPPAPAALPAAKPKRR